MNPSDANKFRSGSRQTAGRIHHLPLKAPLTGSSFSISTAACAGRTNATEGSATLLGAQRPTRTSTPLAAGIVLILTLLSGCATHQTIQIDESPERTITTITTAESYFTGAQTISRLRATTTDKTQTVGSTGVDQQAISENAVKFVESIERSLEKLSPK